MEALPTLEDDGLTTPTVGEWGQEKYQLVRCYAQVFATSMKNAFECRVYIDLFAGSGRAKLRDSNRIVPASPILVLSINDPFDRYVFCDLSEHNLEALRLRKERGFAARRAEFVPGDVNKKIDEVIGLIPQHSKSFRVLTFCFVDPFNIDDLKFETIRALAVGGRKIDFLILVPSGMDAQRNWKRENALYADFLGTANWRTNWEKERHAGRTFANFFVDEFARSMERNWLQMGGRSNGPSNKERKKLKDVPLNFF
ncbi:MAG TPA: three-Cys-motif partner protein TcmP [Thermoanaerobaculia bacterium]|nr:three-Cys-motif partner protein TcmP [Thermoanaerobaculia bacterium]